jgi:primosomal replication protein N
LTLQHEGDQFEAGAPRSVMFELTAHALGSAAAKAQAASLSQVVQVQGFMAPPRKGAKTLVLHITDIAFEN